MVHTMLDLHLDQVVLHMDVHHAFNYISQITIFQKWRSYIDSLDEFSHMFDDFMHVCPQDISRMLFIHEDFIVILFKFNTWQGDLLNRMLFTLTYFRIFCPTIAPHLTFVFPSLVDDMYIVGVFSNVVPTFVQLEAKFVASRFSIQLVVHNLVSIRIRPIHIISFRSYYIWHMFLYFKCTNVSYANHGVLCHIGTLRGSQ